MATRRFSRIATVALAAVFVVSLLAVFAIQRARRVTLAGIAPQKHAIPSSERERAFRDVADLRDVAFTTTDGLTLRGWFSPGRNRAAIILVHGGGRDRTMVFPQARSLARHGYGFLVYDSRASGESDGDHTTCGDRERLDVTAALDFVTAQDEVDPKRVAVLGISNGANATALVAAKDTRVRAVILSAIWTSLEDEMAADAGRPKFLTRGFSLDALRSHGVDVDAVRPIDHVREISPRPILFIAGASDTDTPVAVIRRMFDAAAEPKELWIVPGAGHGKAFETAPREWESRVTKFLDASL